MTRLTNNLMSEISSYWYMDNFVIFTTSRHKLKRILKHVYRVLDSLGLKLAKAKTWPLTSGQGRVSRGISFLGYEISPSGVELSKRSFDSMLARFRGLYEQGAGFQRLTNYVRLWIKWARSGVSVDAEKLKLKTTQILQNTFNVQVPLTSI